MGQKADCKLWALRIEAAEVPAKAEIVPKLQETS